MLKHFLIITWRNLLRNKTFTLINVLGLALGIGCSLLIILWVKDERSMDAFQINKGHLYTVYERVFSDGKVDGAYWTPGQLASELKRKVPEIEFSSSYNPNQSATFEVGEKIITMNGAAADSDFFKMFSYPLLEGTAATALNTRDKIVISRRMANEFFGSPAAAINQVIHYDNARVFRIGAVFEDPGTNSSDRFDYLMLAMFTSEQRTKEIGIRKVLGASGVTIFGMLSRDFLQLVGLAFIVASPVAWLVMDNWLQEYPYRTSVSWWIFALAGITAMIIALLTISWQAIRAAMGHPISSLRSE